MVNSKTSILLIFLILFSLSSAALSFRINIGDVTKHSVKDVQYKDNVSNIQDINATVENIGSIGCTYRLKADFAQNNTSFERFSSPKPLWQGEYAFMGINYVPVNYTGKVHTNLSIEYCGQMEHIDSFSFNVEEKTLINETVESRTVSSNDDRAKIEVEGDLLVPEEEPSYWKTSSAKITNGTTEIRYDAPIFQETEQLKYTVLEDGEIKGTTTVSLIPEPTLKEKLLERKDEVAAAMLGVSVLINILLILKISGITKKIRGFEYNLPDFKK